LVSGGYLFQGCLIPNDPDRMIVDLNPVYDRLDVGLLNGIGPDVMFSD
jgi:hypothetical protein